MTGFTASEYEEIFWISNPVLQQTGTLVEENECKLLEKI